MNFRSIMSILIAACLLLFACGDGHLDNTCDGDVPPDGDTVKDGDVDSEADSDSPAACTVGERRCGEAQVIERCTVAGIWETYYDCQSDNQRCVDGVCAALPDGDADTENPAIPCEPGTYRCRGLSEIQKCSPDGTSWELYRDCVGDSVCLEGDCVAYVEPCTPGAFRCVNDSESQQCRTDGQGWEHHDSCDWNEICVPNGSCRKITIGLDDIIDHHSLIGPDGYGCTDDAECGANGLCWKSGYGGISGVGWCIPNCATTAYQCPAGYVCQDDENDIQYGFCRSDFWNPACPICEQDSDCAPDAYCERFPPKTEGNCRPRCSAGLPCNRPFRCDLDTGTCVLGDGHGDCGGDCPNGYICDPRFNYCRLNCPTCGAYECCDADSAPNCIGHCDCFSNPPVSMPGFNDCCFGYFSSACWFGEIGFCI